MLLFGSVDVDVDVDVVADLVVVKAVGDSKDLLVACALDKRDVNVAIVFIVILFCYFGIQ